MGTARGFTDLSLAHACASGHPAQNNLGGRGPDIGAEEIRYSGVATVDGVSVDLVVRAMSAYTSARGAQRNGCASPIKNTKL